MKSGKYSSDDGIIRAKEQKRIKKRTKHKIWTYRTAVSCALLAFLLAAGTLTACQGKEKALGGSSEETAAVAAVETVTEAEPEPEPEPEPETDPEPEAAAEEEPAAEDTASEEAAPAEKDTSPADETPEAETTQTGTATGVALEDIPAYSGNPYVVVNDNVPFFTEDEFTLRQFETYSKLDALGRCGTAYANVCRDLMPMEERGDISQIRPSGWHNNPYDFIDGGYVYNRCHLIGYQLAGENANEKNLITGTRYMNTEGMLPFENMTADYVQETDGHVLYRVTPLFEGDNLVADGVLMEACSVEDHGEGIKFCVYCYNVQPGVEIDYATGHNKADGTLGGVEDAEDEEEMDYILNTNSLKFHYPDCDAVKKMKEKNKKEYTGKRADLIDMGYEPCGICRP